MRLPTAFLLIFLLLAGCEPAAEEAAPDRPAMTMPRPQERLPEAEPLADSLDTEAGTRQFIQGEFSVPAAMEVIYGLYDQNIECSKWICKPREEKAFASKMNESGVLHTRPANLFSFASAEGEKKLLVTATAGRGKEGWESCHACAPILGAALFMEVEGDWYIEALRKDLDEVGAWGELPEHQLVQIGPNAWGIQLDFGFTNQGISEGGKLIFGIVEGRFQPLLDELTYFSNEGMFFEENAPAAYAYQSVLSWDTTSAGAYWDLLLNTSGRRPIQVDDPQSEIVDFEEVRRFRLQGEAYTEVVEAPII